MQGCNEVSEFQARATEKYSLLHQALASWAEEKQWGFGGVPLQRAGDGTLALRGEAE